MRIWRLVLAVLGIVGLLYGAARLLTEIPVPSLIALAIWLVGAVVIHDGLLSPAVLAVSAVVERLPVRARRFVQSGLIVGAMVTVIALPMIYLRGSQPAQKAILQQNYGAHLAILLGLIGLASLVAYAVRVARDRRGDPPPAEA